jgi:hypothetical protein
MSTTITIPNVQLTIDQLVGVVRHLEPDARARVAQALLADEVDARLAMLIKRLASRPPVTDLTDEDIAEEIRSVRRQRRKS